MNDFTVWHDDADSVYVVGTHDLDHARRAAEQHAATADFIEGPPDLDQAPRQWWAAIVFDEDGDRGYPEVPAGTPGAQAVTTWH